MIHLDFASFSLIFSQVFKEPLEQEQTGGPILDQEDIKTIFGKLPDIYDVHRKLKEDLEKLLSDFTEDKCIGQLILPHVSICQRCGYSVI